MAVRSLVRNAERTELCFRLSNPAARSLEPPISVPCVGIKFGVTRRSTYERELPQILRAATVVPVLSLKKAVQMLERDGCCSQLLAR